MAIAGTRVESSVSRAGARRSGSPPQPGSSRSRRWAGWTWASRPGSARSRSSSPLWVPMMAAMMLPGAAPAVLEARRGERPRTRRAAVRRRRTSRSGRSWASPCTRCTGRTGRVVAGAGRDRGRRLRAHAAQAALPPALPRERPLRLRVRALLRRLEHRADAGARGAGRHEHRLDGRDRRARRRPEAPARQGRRRRAAGARDRRRSGS